MSTFREAVPKMAILWRADGLRVIRISANRARRAYGGLKNRTAYRSLIEVCALAWENAADAFDATWAREMARRPELTSGLDADVSVDP